MVDITEPKAASLEKAVPAAPMQSSRLKLRLFQALTLIFVIGITIYIYSIRDQAPALARYGYPGIFLLSILANATIILPAPGLAIVFTFGGVFSPLGVGLAAGLGAAIGELSGYLAGMSGQAIIDNPKLYERFEGYMRKYGGLTITVLAFLPLPVFDLAGVAAGALKMPVHKFLLYCAAGKIPKMILVALAGAYSVDWVLRYVH
jgi:membrane protein DedA with SNARE-associated domain